MFTVETNALSRHGHFSYRFEKYRIQGIPEVSGISLDVFEKMISARDLKVLAN